MYPDDHYLRGTLKFQGAQHLNPTLNSKRERHQRRIHIAEASKECKRNFEERSSAKIKYERNVKKYQAAMKQRKDPGRINPNKIWIWRSATSWRAITKHDNEEKVDP